MMFTTLLGILFAVVNLAGPDLVQAADAAQRVAQPWQALTAAADALPGPDISIDFSRGDWWVGLLFYLVMQWMRQRNGKGR